MYAQKRWAKINRSSSKSLRMPSVLQAPSRRNSSSPPFPRLIESIPNEVAAHDPPSIDSPSISKKSRTDAQDPFHDIELDFAEDNMDALLILLQIVHLQFAKVPKSLSYNTLLGVTLMCDQYDCRNLVKPWLADWMKEEWHESNIGGQEGWLFIAYYFGRQDVFPMLATTCALQGILKEGKRYFILGGYHYPAPFGPGTAIMPHPLEKPGVPLPASVSGLFQDVPVIYSH